MIKYAAILGALSLSGCMSPPEPPATIPPVGTLEPFGTTSSTRIEPVPDDWWRLYDDPVLNRLVQESLAANVDLRIAFANLDAARGAESLAQANRLPQTPIETGLTVDGTSSQPSANSVPSTDWDLGATASWDIDLFGRLRSTALAAKADVEAQQAALDGVRVAVVADTVQAYLDLCGYTRLTDTAHEIAAAQDRSRDLVRSQLEAGEVSPLELSQAATLASTARAAIAPMEAQRTSALYRLGVLQGKPPAAARQLALSCSALPRLRASAPVGDGTALLLRRPDIREAERKLAAASARIGVARADLYPRFNLGGALGLLTGRFDAALTPLVSWSFPNQGPARAKLSQAKATERAALATWDATVLKALREVESAIVNYDAEVRRNRSLDNATTEAAAYARRAAAKVRLGDAPGLLRIDGERTLASARQQQELSDLAIAQSQVILFRSLGGGWQTSNSKR